MIALLTASTAFAAIGTLLLLCLTVWAIADEGKPEQRTEQRERCEDYDIASGEWMRFAGPRDRERLGL